MSQPREFLCPICLTPPTFGVILQQCSHSFCRDCWVRHCVRSSSCPICRHPNCTSIRNRAIESEDHAVSEEHKSEAPNEANSLENVCAICRNDVPNVCIACEENVNDTNHCLPCFGVCGHKFHYHCMMRRLDRYHTCPLDDTHWKFVEADLLPITIQVQWSPTTSESDITASYTFAHLSYRTTGDDLLRRIRDIWNDTAYEPYGFVCMGKLIKNRLLTVCVNDFRRATLQLVLKSADFNCKTK